LKCSSGECILRSLIGKGDRPSYRLNELPPEWVLAKIGHSLFQIGPLTKNPAQWGRARFL
jgi:hypothetical protein